jgi:Holliday junction DNA helicase RuvB
MSKERVTSPTPTADEERSESLLRPKRLDDFVGQTDLKENLRVFVEAAKQRGDALDHVIFYGPPGLGKTTLAHIVANELEVPIKLTSGPAFQNAAELLGVLSHVERCQVVFIDEIHRLPRMLEEHLYQAMEDLKCELIVDKGPNARHYTLNLQPFTLIGATTRVGMITAPMRDRFGVTFRLDFYSPEELKKIVERSAGLLNIDITEEGAVEIARRARGTPRIANRLLKRIRDFAQVEGRQGIDRDIADYALGRLQVDSEGLDEMDRRILRYIVEKFGGGPVGINSLSVAVSEESETIEDVYEPFLIQCGFLKRTSRGRVATPRALTHLGLTGTQPEGDSPGLF